MDLEQRDGRGVRQGNEVYGPVLDSSGAVIDPGAGIRIFVYLTARSFDGYVFQAIEAKARGFKAILRRSITMRVVEDIDEVVLVPPGHPGRTGDGGQGRGAVRGRSGASVAPRGR